MLNLIDPMQNWVPLWQELSKVLGGYYLEHGYLKIPIVNSLSVFKKAIGQ